MIYIAENGQLAIHVPITAARLGAYSTRTAHPEVVHLLQQTFSSLLQIPLQIENPFLYRTKAEVIRTLCQSHSHILLNTVSCWKASRVTEAHHCGFCVPCIIRRIALEYWNAGRCTQWGRDLFSEKVADLPPEVEGKRNLTELSEFYSYFWDDVSDANLWTRFPELVSLRFSLNDAIALYRRAAKEARTVFARYPGLAEILR